MLSILNKGDGYLKAMRIARTELNRLLGLSASLRPDFFFFETHNADVILGFVGVLIKF